MKINSSFRLKGFNTQIVFGVVAFVVLGILLIFEVFMPKPSLQALDTIHVKPDTIYGKLIEKWGNVRMEHAYDKQYRPFHYEHVDSLDKEVKVFASEYVRDYYAIGNNLWEDIFLDWNRKRVLDNRPAFYLCLNEYFNDYIKYYFSKDFSMKKLSPVCLEFAMDTFRVNEICRILAFNEDDINFAQKLTVYKREAEEYLIYKYYSKVYKLLDFENREILRKSEAAWEECLSLDQELDNNVFYDCRICQPNLSLRPRSEFLFKIYRSLSDDR